MKENTIINSDCLKAMADFPSESVNCVITSPPYNKNGYRGKKDTSKGKGRWSGSDISYGDFSDNLDEIDYQKQQIDLLNECYRVLKKDGSMFYNHKVRRNAGVASHPFSWIGKSNLKFYQQIIWDRGSCVDHNINYLNPTTEIIFWLVKDKPKVFKKEGYFSEEIWRINALPSDHPAPFPEILVEACLNLTTNENDIVLDPYMGSGTTAVVAKRMKRNYLGIELNPEYIKLAEERIKSIGEPLF